MAEAAQVPTADIVELERRGARDNRDFENTLAVLRQGFRQRLPEARKKGERLCASYHQMAVNCKKQAELIRARAERHLRRAEQIGEILEANKNRNLVRARHGATPETLVKPRLRDPITMLVEKGKLDNDQERAAREIATIRQAMVSALVPKITMLGAGQSPRRGIIEDRMPEDIAMLRHDRYLPWSRALAGKDNVSLPLVIDVAVDGVSVNRACRRHRIGYARGVKLIGKALTLYNKYRWQTPGAGNGVDRPV